jgi:hypothetical protein
MLRGLLDLARGAQTSPVPACSCAKGLAIGVETLSSVLRGCGGSGADAAVGSSTAPPSAPTATAAAAPAPAPSAAEAAAAFHSAQVDGLPPHDAHALRTVLMYARTGG